MFINFNACREKLETSFLPWFHSPSVADVLLRETDIHLPLNHNCTDCLNCTVKFPDLLLPTAQASNTDFLTWFLLICLMKCTQVSSQFTHILQAKVFAPKSYSKISWEKWWAWQSKFSFIWCTWVVCIYSNLYIQL